MHFCAVWHVVLSKAMTHRTNQSVTDCEWDDMVLCSIWPPLSRESVLKSAKTNNMSQWHLVTSASKWSKVNLQGRGILWRPPAQLVTALWERDSRGNRLIQVQTAVKTIVCACVCMHVRGVMCVSDLFILFILLYMKTTQYNIYSEYKNSTTYAVGLSATSGTSHWRRAP